MSNPTDSKGRTWKPNTPAANATPQVESGPVIDRRGRTFTPEKKNAAPIIVPAADEIKEDKHGRVWVPESKAPTRPVRGALPVSGASPAMVHPTTIGRPPSELVQGVQASASTSASVPPTQPSPAGKGMEKVSQNAAGNGFKRLVFVNLSTLVDDASVELMAAAINAQLHDDVCPAWGLLPVPVVFSPSKMDTRLEDGDVPVVFINNDQDVPGAGGFHDEGQGRADTGNPFGVEGAYSAILCSPYVDAGLSPFDDGSISTAASHECIEVVLDFDANTWVDCEADSGLEQIREGCDRVEGSVYGKRVLDPAGRTNIVPVSNFLLSPAFNADAPPGQQRDFMATLEPTGGQATSLDMTAGGYVTVRKVGVVSQKFVEMLSGVEVQGGLGKSGEIYHVFGPEMPAWKRDLKMGKASRVGRRFA